MALLQPDEASVRTSLIVQLNGRTGRLAVRRRPRSLASSHPPMGLAFAATFRGFALSRSSTSCWARLHSRSSTASANTARCWPTTMKWEIWCYPESVRKCTPAASLRAERRGRHGRVFGRSMLPDLQMLSDFHQRPGGDNDTSGNLIETVRDPGVKRNRKRYIIAEAVPDFVNPARQRAIWEMNRRTDGRALRGSLSIAGSTARASCGHRIAWRPSICRL